jgi:dynein heavy chain
MPFLQYSTKSSDACRNLHVVLCFSPVGDKFRIRARQFPALVNCTAFDWFHGWPHEALVSVSQRFLIEIPDLEEDVRTSIAYHMAFVHTEVTSASVAYLQRVRRYCYTTPKSYLELISLYKTLLARKREALARAKDRLVSGVEKIAQASAQVCKHLVVLYCLSFTTQRGERASSMLMKHSP